MSTKKTKSVMNSTERLQSIFIYRIMENFYFKEQHNEVLVINNSYIKALDRVVMPQYFNCKQHVTDIYLYRSCTSKYEVLTRIHGAHVTIPC